MKIFVGGLRKIHQDNLQRRCPNADLIFASFDSNMDEWLRKAKQADVAIIDQSRCNHTTTNHLRKFLRVPIHFTDSKARIRELVQELHEHGHTDHSYV